MYAIRSYYGRRSGSQGSLVATMARTPFQVEVLTPEGPIFSGEVEMVSTRTEVGSIGILAHHTPLLGMLAPAELKLYLSETEIVSFAQGEGYIQVADNHALVLVEEAIKADELVREELQAQIDARNNFV